MRPRHTALARAIAPAALCLLTGAGPLAHPKLNREPVLHPAPIPSRTVSNDRSSAIPSELVGVPEAERGDTSTGLSGALRVHLLSPGTAEPGVYPLPAGVAGHPFAFVGVIPFSAKRGAEVNGYRLGYWPAELHAVRSDAYENPTGFVEVTAANADLQVSAHLQLRDLVTHDGPSFPKYVVLSEPLLDKLELVLSDLDERGVPTRHIVVLSGFRTPAYNFALGDASGRARESRHQYGDAADIIVDADGDGRMDDLNHDGRVDGADIAVIESAVNRVERAYPQLAGGLGMYDAEGPSGPFAHIDVRGSKARWGTLGRRTRWQSQSLAAGSRTPRVTGHCFAEGESAVLCQGFRHGT